MAFKHFAVQATVSTIGLVIGIGFLSGDLTSGQMHSLPEHNESLALFPANQATHRAVRSGAWSAAATWDGGTMPGRAAKVMIPEGISVNYDLADSETIQWIRIEGGLTFDRGKDLTLRVDSIVSTARGSFELGTQALPIPANRTVRILFSAGSDIDGRWDPKKFSRGLVTQGPVAICGAGKTPWMKSGASLGVGATSLELEGQPQNWSAGDKLVIHGTQPPKYYKGPEKAHLNESYDDVVTITKIEGSRVTFSPALKHAHTLPAGPRFKLYIGNLTRNVRFESEGGVATPVGRRGHVMIMGSPARVENAAFIGMGRTDKSKPSDDLLVSDYNSNILRYDKLVLDSQDKPVPNPQPHENPRGRYPLHFHKLGFDQVAIARGCVVEHSHGWGFVNHQSWVDMEDNVSFDVFGTHFVSEDGNEIGAYRRNLAVKALGSLTTVKSGEDALDLAHNGHGFWFQSRAHHVEGNIAASCANEGIINFNRGGLSGIPYYNRAMDGRGIRVDIDKSEPRWRRLERGSETAYFRQHPFPLQRGNTVIACDRAFHSVNSGDFKHDVRNLVTDLVGWNVRSAFIVEYNENYTFADCYFLASDQRGYPGFFNNDGARHMTMVRVSFDNFGDGPLINVGRRDTPNPDLILTDLVAVDVFRDGRLMGPSDLTEYEPAIHEFKTSSDLVPGRLRFESGESKLYRVNDRKLRIDPVLIDSVGPRPLDIEWSHQNVEDLLGRGYYRLNNGNIGLLVREIAVDRITNERLYFSVGVDLGDKNVAGLRNLGSLEAALAAGDPGEPEGQGSTGGATGGSNVGGGSGSGSSSGGSASSGVSTGAASTGMGGTSSGSSGGSSSSGTSGSGTGTGSTGGTTGSVGSPVRLDWVISVSTPKPGSKLRLGTKAKTLHGRITGIETNAGPVIVETAVVRAGNGAGAVWMPSKRPGKANRKGTMKFNAPVQGGTTPPGSGERFEVWVRASDDRFVKRITATNRVPYVAR